MIINNLREDKAFEADVDFSTQREYLLRYQPSYGYFFDWLAAIYWELQGKCSPYEYATRVAVAEKILENTNLDYILASQKALLRVVRNLFPYDKLSGQIPAGLQVILGASGNSLRKPRFRFLLDSAIKNPALVQQRYKVLARAFCGQAINLLKILREVVDEEEIVSHLSLSADLLKHSKDDLTELIRLRKEYFLGYPEEELCSVADQTLIKEVELKRRSELPKDMEPEYMLKLIGKLESVLRGKLQSVIIEAKNTRELILSRRKVYIDELNELLSMCMAVREYIGAASFEEINAGSDELVNYIDQKFALQNFLPVDVLADLEQGNAMYRSGYL